MSALSAGRDARPAAGNTVYYERHRPERTLPYQIIAEYYPAFMDLMSAQGRALPVYVQREFEDDLRCGRLEHGFLRVRSERYAEAGSIPCEPHWARHLISAIHPNGSWVSVQNNKRIMIFIAGTRVRMVWFSRRVKMDHSYVLLHNNKRRG